MESQREVGLEEACKVPSLLLSLSLSLCSLRLPLSPTGWKGLGVAAGEAMLRRCVKPLLIHKLFYTVKWTCDSRKEREEVSCGWWEGEEGGREGGRGGRDRMGERKKNTFIS